MVEPSLRWAGKIVLEFAGSNPTLLSVSVNMLDLLAYSDKSNYGHNKYIALLNLFKEMQSLTANALQESSAL